MLTWLSALEKEAGRDGYRSILKNDDEVIDALAATTDRRTGEQIELIRQDKKLKELIEKKICNSLIDDAYTSLEKGKGFTAKQVINWIKKSFGIEKFDVSGQILRLTMIEGEAPNSFWDRLYDMGRQDPVKWGKRQLLLVLVNQLPVEYKQHMKYARKVEPVVEKLEELGEFNENSIREVLRCLTDIELEKQKPVTPESAKLVTFDGSKNGHAHFVGRSNQTTNEPNYCRKRICNGKAQHLFKECKTCNKCHEWGHFSKECKNKRKVVVLSD